MKRFEGKVVFVAGASSSSGIGRASVKRFAAEGAIVVFCARRGDQVTSLQDEVRATGAIAEGKVVDVNDLDAYAAALESTFATYGKLDVFVHNASFSVAARFSDGDQSIWDGSFNLNAKACYVANATAVKLMKANGGGSIVNIATIAAVRSVPNYGAYGAAKAAMVQLSKSLAVECARDGVRVNVVAPGMIGTDTLLKAFNNDQQAAAAIADRIPMGRFGTPEELAAAILFFASDDASYVTGQFLLVDGGKQAQIIV